MKKLKKYAALGLSVALMSALTACGNAPQGSSDNPATQITQGNHSADSNDAITYDSCELTFSWWGDTSTNESTLAAIEAFEAKYPGITVTSSFGSWTGWEESMTSQFKTGLTSDINQINAGWINNYSPDGTLFLDLNTVSDVLDTSGIDGKYLDMCTLADELQAVPVAITGKTFFWDKTTFDKAGIAVPATMDELIAAGKTFQEELGDEYYPLVLEENDKIILMVYYLESIYGKPFLENNTLNYTEEELTTGMEFIHSLEAAHVIPSSMEVANSDSATLPENSKWANGKYAGVFAWDYEAANFEASLKKGREFVVGSKLTDIGEYQGGFSKITMAYAISEECEHPREAALFIDFLLNQHEAAAIIGLDKGIPLSNDALSACKEQKLLNDSLSKAHNQITGYTLLPPDSPLEAEAFTGSNGTYFMVMAGMSYGAYEPAAAAEMLHTDMAEALKSMETN